MFVHNTEVYLIESQGASKCLHRTPKQLFELDRAQPDRDSRKSAWERTALRRDLIVTVNAWRYGEPFFPTELIRRSAP